MKRLDGKIAIIAGAGRATAKLFAADSQFITGYSLTPDGGTIIDAAR